MREKLLLVIALAFVQLNMLAQTQEHSDNPLAVSYTHLTTESSPLLAEN